MLFSLKVVLIVLTVALTDAPAAAALMLNDLNDYTNNFDFLSSQTTSNAWTNDQASESTSGSPGWYWQNGSAGLTYEAGSAGTPGPFSLGDSSLPGDRAMGNYADGSHPNTAWGIVFQNNSGQTISQIDVSYHGEQWRKASTSIDTLQFSFNSSATDITDLVPADDASPAGWTTGASLSFTAPLASGTPPFFDPIAPTPVSGSISVNVPNGHFLALRWYDGDITGDDAALGIDDLTVSFTATAVPEPSAFLFGGLVCSILLVVTRLRKRFNATE